MLTHKCELMCSSHIIIDAPVVFDRQARCVWITNRELKARERVVKEK